MSLQAAGPGGPGGMDMQQFAGPGGMDMQQFAGPGGMDYSMGLQDFGGGCGKGSGRAGGMAVYSINSNSN